MLLSAFTLCVSMQKKIPEGLKAGFITSDGYTYLASCVAATDGIIRVPLQDLKQTNTALLPHAYPFFLTIISVRRLKYLFRGEGIETLELSFDGVAEKDCGER